MACSNVVRSILHSSSRLIACGAYSQTKCNPCVRSVVFVSVFLVAVFIRKQKAILVFAQWFRFLGGWTLDACARMEFVHAVDFDAYDGTNGSLKPVRSLYAPWVNSSFSCARSGWYFHGLIIHGAILPTFPISNKS